VKPKHQETIEMGIDGLKKDTGQKKEMWRIKRMIIRRQKNEE
jgi:hypothetical protein